MRDVLRLPARRGPRPDPRTSRSVPARAIGSIITPDAARSRACGAERQAERVAQDHLLEADAGAEPQRPRAQAADRPRRQLEHPTPVSPSSRTSACTGPSRSPSGRGRRGGQRLDSAQLRRREAATA